MNQELKYYMSLSYRMEIFEDKDEGGICIILSRSSWMYDMFRFTRWLVRTNQRRKRNMDFRYVRRCKRDSAS